MATTTQFLQLVSVADFENLSRNALAFFKLASIRLILRRLCSK
jgi:hypothetical protein